MNQGPILRVRTGCFTCRSRKKKCDEVKPVCAGCHRNKLDCRWPTQSQIITRKRTRRSSSISSPRETRPASAGSSPAPAQPGDRGGPDRPASGRDGVDDDKDADDGLVDPQRARHRRPSPSSVSQASPPNPDPEPAGFDPEPLALQSTQGETEGSSMDHSSSLVRAHVDHGASPGTSLSRNLALLPGVDGPSFDLLGYYLSRTALSMGNGSTDVNPFVSQLIPLCFANNFIFELVLCQSANHRAVEDASKLTLADGYYNKSLQLFRRSITDYVSGRETSPLWIAIGALIMCYTEVLHAPRCPLPTTWRVQESRLTNHANQTAKGDVNGIIFDHINAAGPLLTDIMNRREVIRQDLKDFIVECYVYTAVISMISVDPMFSSRLFLSPELEHFAARLVERGYVGQMCGCWLELLLLIPAIFELGQRVRGAADGAPPSPDDFLAFSALQAQILSFAPPPFLGAQVQLCGQIYKQAIHVYLLTALDVCPGSQTYLRQLIESSVARVFECLDQLSPTARINTSVSWALAVVGACVDDEGRRQKLRDHLEVMFATIGLGNIRATSMLLEKVWELPDSELSPWVICKVMQENEMWVSFV